VFSKYNPLVGKAVGDVAPIAVGVISPTTVPDADTNPLSALAVPLITARAVTVTVFVLLTTPPILNAE